VIIGFNYLSFAHIIKLYTNIPELQERQSHPAWVRGLKQVSLFGIIRARFVAPRVGAWIETGVAKLVSNSPTGRTPRGCVD